MGRHFFILGIFRYTHLNTTIPIGKCELRGNDEGRDGKRKRMIEIKE